MGGTSNRDRPDGVVVELEGETFLLLSLPLSALDLAKLTPAERQVALAAARGASNAEIAGARGCSPRTVANQLASVFRKLGINSRAELVSRLFA